MVLLSCRAEEDAEGRPFEAEHPRLDGRNNGASTVCSHTQFLVAVPGL